MAPDLKAKFTDLNDLVKSLTLCKPHYKVQLEDFKSNLNELLPVVKEIQEMTKHSSIKLLSIKAVKDFEKEVSAGIQLCDDVSKEANLTEKPVFGMNLQRRSDSLRALRGVYAIFKERKNNRDRTETAKQMLQKLDDEIQKLMKVKGNHNGVLKIIGCNLAALKRLVDYVEVVEEHNKNLNLPIEVVQDFRNVLSLGIIHAAELSKKPKDKAPDLKHQLEVYNNSLETQKTRIGKLNRQWLSN